MRSASSAALWKTTGLIRLFAVVLSSGKLIMLSCHSQHVLFWSMQQIPLQPFQCTGDQEDLFVKLMLAAAADVRTLLTIAACTLSCAQCNPAQSSHL